MKTTLRLDDDVLQVARSLARAEGRPLGKVVSSLARKGLEAKPQVGGFPVFDVAPDTPPITLEMVHRALEE